MKRLFTIAILIIGYSTLSFAQDTLKTFIFGHSLINHEFQVNVTPSQETSVPHWFHFLSEEVGYNYEVSGQYGFLPQHASLPPIAQWGFDYVTSAWDSDTEQFSEANFDNILITPGNFIQWQGPSVDYFGDTQSPLDYTSQIFSWTATQEPNMNYYIYENWPDMGPYLSQGFPPNQTEWQTYNDYLQGDFHDWFIEYHDSLILAHPDLCVRMIPTGPIIGNLLNQSPFDQIAIDVLYEDDAPHGRPTIYFLASLITYMAMYEEVPPSTYQVPAIIDPIVGNNYQQAVDFIWAELLAFNDEQGNSRVFCQSPALSITEAAADFTVFPNPTNDFISVRSANEIQKLVLIDMTGRTIQVSKGHQMELNSIVPGQYTLLIFSEAGDIKTTRLIKE